jgi:hypothetical protein
VLIHKAALRSPVLESDLDNTFLQHEHVSARFGAPRVGGRRAPEDCLWRTESSVSAA